MPSQGRWAKPVATRSAIVLEVARELSSINGFPFRQSTVIMRPQGGGEGSLTFFGSDTTAAIQDVAAGAAQLAIINPAEPLTLAVRGQGPFSSPLPLRVIAVIPSYDQYAFSVSEETGIHSLEELRDRRYPLRVSLRGQRDHSNHFFENIVLKELGFSFADIESWGGQVRYDPGLPTGTATSGPDIEHSRVDMAADGEIDAIWDEAVYTWVPKVLDLGFRILPLSEHLVENLEAMGFRRGMLLKKDYPKLPHDILSLDFSGWPIYTHADADDEIVTGICMALDKRKANIPWQGTGPLPLERMCFDTAEGPLDVPLHPAAERYWRTCGYLKA